MFIQLPDIIILAGGLGTRLKEEVENLPKVMAPVNGKPFLEYLLDYIAKSGFQRVILSTGYLNHFIQDYFRDRYKSVDIVYSIEDEPLGTGGALKKAFKHVHTPFFMVMNGDTMFRINLQKFFERHIEFLANLSIALRPVDDASRYGKVVCGDDSTIISFQEKSSDVQPGLINGGLYIIKTKYFNRLELPDKFSIENDFLQNNVQEGEFIGQIFYDYFIDIGIPQDYKRAQIELNAFDDR